MFKNIATENELRKIYARLMKKGLSEGFKLPSLSSICASHPDASEMRKRAEEAGWKSRDIAVAVLMGMIISRKKAALTISDDKEVESMSRYAWDLLLIVKANSWYTTSCISLIETWTHELVNS